MTKLEHIESAAKAYAAARDDLAEIVGNLNDEIAAAKRRLVPTIKRRLAKAAERQAALQALITDAPECFAKPRTVVLHGIKVGFEKGKGSVTFDDADRVVGLIRRHMPEQFEALVKTKHTPIKTAIAQLLSAGDCKRIGCSVVDAGDLVVIRPVDSEVDKMVDALLKDATDQAEEQAA